MNISELFQAIDVLDTIHPLDNEEIRGIAYHSGKVKEGYLFVCIKGYETDGHKFLPMAKENGAVAAIVEDFQHDIDIPQYKVKNSRSALARLSANFYNYPSRRLKMIGISATNGKTSTTFMTNSILEEHQLQTGLLGTVDVKIGDCAFPSNLTTPESLELQQFLTEMNEANVSHAMMEVSSAAMEMSRVETVDYDIVTMNNISREHIETHGSFERYFDVKSRLIKDAKEDAFAILNLDCPYSRSLIDQTKAQVVTFGIEDTSGHVTCEHLDLSTGRAHFTLKVNKPIETKNRTIEPQSFDIQLSVSGLHSVYNSLVAITIALLENVPPKTIQRGINSFTGVSRRFEVIYDEDFMIIDDHFANRGNINVTLNTLTAMDYNKLHLVYAIRGNRGIDVNKENAETIVEWAKKLNLNSIIATKSISNVTYYDEVSREEEEVFLQVMEDAKISVILYNEL
ncbi:MAG TPA: UDP-N-acetylmuramyl-tripeptide synthetase, partial [Bacillota bacterium]|nr:UDP-N-acetylmuramyl-tripeptide synthetase [Bacillota bacterium]